ncbi:alkyl sulfatase dimerization domain-containing protein [Cupriavidus metallidurans]|uniref:alkyl sulfatase dimerization domain-containing protein n=1 Tax=Cupriavidus metallidurans TaxID=119219 RepID=UPI001CCD3783|nr:alkyl sulfatase dimerization domain-containing protein [Cupriavidus metallidurans]UBM08512.1 MBL fold metallo-hydrolase [Cupriavidus metallidurans]
MNAIEDRPAALITGKGIDAIGDGIWLLHGQGQSFVADVGDGLLVVDSGPGGRITAGMIDVLRTQTDLPVLAICYSHGHLGYNAGVKQWLDHAAQRGDPAPRILAHVNVLARQKRYRETQRMQERMAEIQFRHASGALAGKLGQNRPTETFTEGITVGHGDRRAEVLWAPSETDDAVAVWLPGSRLLYSGPAVIDSIPNVGTPFRTMRDTVRWAETLERLASLRPETVVREFGPSLQGEDTCQHVLLHTARALRWMREEVVRLMNAGCNEREMLAALQPPPDLFEQPWMQPTYGDPTYIARDIYRSENGWWDRNATSLHPAAPQTVAAEIAAAIADHGAIVRHARGLADRGEIQLALHVIDLLAQASGDAPHVVEARQLKAEWLRARSKQVRSYVSRSLYVAAAMVLESGSDDNFGIH